METDDGPHTCGVIFHTLQHFSFSSGILSFISSRGVLNDAKKEISMIRINSGL